MKGRRYLLMLLVGCCALLGPTLLFGPNAGFAGTRRGLRYDFTMTSPTNSRQLRFEDEFIKATFDVNRKKIAFSLLNHTGNPIKINWNEVAYIDSDGQSHKCEHQQSTSIVPPTAKIKDLIIPMDYLYAQNSGRFGPQQREIQFLPKVDKKAAQAYKGKSFSVFMPVEENGVVKNYLFTFQIDIVLQ